jgi:hypothetical protein
LQLQVSGTFFDALLDFSVNYWDEVPLEQIVNDTLEKRDVVSKEFRQ